MLHDLSLIMNDFVDVHSDLFSCLSGVQDADLSVLSQTMAQCCKNIKETVQMLASRHKDIHGSVSKVGKAIDRVRTESNNLKQIKFDIHVVHFGVFCCRILMQRSALWWQKQCGTPQRDRSTWVNLLWSICTGKECLAWQRTSVRWVIIYFIDYFAIWTCQLTLS